MYLNSGQRLKLLESKVDALTLSLETVLKKINALEVKKSKLKRTTKKEQATNANT